MNVLKAERICGIETFFTSFAGVGGKLRFLPEDFIVEELFKHPEEKTNGTYTIAEVSAKSWETNRLISQMSKSLGISRRRIGFAGTKDKRSISSQLMSFYNVPKEKVLAIKLKDVTLTNVYTSYKPVKIGELKGNKFKIVVREIIKPSASENVQKNITEIQKTGGFPNFYGIQRFGVTRPISHIVGKHIVNGDFKSAVMTYIANPIKGENEETYKLREKLKQTHDYSEALKNYPDQLNYEKAMLNYLVKNTDDFIGAIQELPRNLQTMFIYAYQSYIFNKILSKRIQKKLPLNKALEGDIILPVRKNIVDEKAIIVTSINCVKVNKQISKGKAFVSGPLVGNDTLFSQGEMGELEHSIIDKEICDPRDFTIPDIPRLSSSGSRRALLAHISDLKCQIVDDEWNENKKKMVVQFALRKGCYATSFMREIMKSDDIKKY